MSANLDERTDEAGKAMFYVGDTPWHREGRPLEHPPSVSEALVEGGLDWRVERRPMWTLSGPLPEGVSPADAKIEGQVTRVSTNFAVCRCDRTGEDAQLGVVGSRYSVLQNHEAFAVYQPFLESGLLDLESGGALRGGRDVWMLGRFQPEQMIRQAVEDVAQEIRERVIEEMEAIFGEDEEIEPYALIHNSHDGSGSVSVRETPIRVVCRNTLSLALNGGGRAINVRHTGAVDEKVHEAAAELWAGLVSRYRTLAELYPILRRRHVPGPVFERLVLDEVAPLKPEEELDTARAQTEQEKRIEKRDEIEELWIGGAGHVGDESAWEAYNALVQAVDHSPRWMRGRSGGRVRQMIDGGLERTKRKVGDRLARYATDEPFRERVLTAVRN